MKVSKLNPSSTRDLEIGLCYLFINEFDHALFHYEKYLEEQGDGTPELLNHFHRIAYAYAQLGFQEKAKYYSDKQIELCIDAEISGSYYFISGMGPYDLAGVYATTGQKAKSLEYIGMVNQIEKFPAWAFHMIRLDPLFDSIRDEPEFQQILHDVEVKYLAEHNRVKEWLAENSKL
jgi:tetratricopeptide (TPR) repeat protein